MKLIKMSQLYFSKVLSIGLIILGGCITTDRDVEPWKTSIVDDNVGKPLSVSTTPQSDVGTRDLSFDQLTKENQRARNTVDEILQTVIEKNNDIGSLRRDIEQLSLDVQRLHEDHTRKFERVQSLEKQSKSDSIGVNHNRDETNLQVSKDHDPAEFDSLPIFGYVENIYLGPEKIKFKAKLDSGAKTSSLNAFDLMEFERDGKNWARFKMINPNNNEEVVFERRIVRHARIKQHGSDNQKRPVILMEGQLGNHYTQHEFTLAGREKFIYQVLVGRNFLNGIGLIDVSKTFLHKVDPFDHGE